MKKLIDRIKSVGWERWSKILIGFLILAILWTMFFAFRANAGDLLSDYYQIVPYGNWQLGVTSDTSITFRIFYRDTSIYKENYMWLVVRTSSEFSFGASLYSAGTYVKYVSLVNDTNNPSFFYNIYKVQFAADTNYIDISFPASNGELLAEPYGLFIFPYSDRSTEVEQYINNIVDELNNYPDYVVNIQSIFANDERVDLLQLSDNTGIIFDQQLYTGFVNQSIRVVGQLATTTGIDYYSASVGSDSVGLLSNVTSDQFMSTDFVNYVSNSGLDIYDYDHNGVFDLTVDLSNYINQTVPVTISAHSNDNKVRFVVGIIQVSVFSPTDPPLDPPEDESDTEVDPGGEVIPPPDDGNYNEGYLAGYEAALRDNDIGVFSNCVLQAYYSFRHSSGIDFPILVEFTFNPTSGSVNFHDVYNWYANSKYNSIDYSLKEIELLLVFNDGFTWLDGIMWVSFDPNISTSSSWLPYNTEAFSVQHEDGALLEISYAPLEGKNKWYMTYPTDYTTRLDIDMIKIMVNSRNLSYEDFFITCNFTLHTNISQFTTNRDSYNRGYNDGYYEGNDVGYKTGMERGYDLGYNNAEEMLWNRAYAEASSTYYNEGRAAGIIIGKDLALKEGFVFYDLFFSIFDAPISVLSTAFNFEIFGVNIAAFILGIFTLLLAHKAVKMVL